MKLPDISSIDNPWITSPDISVIVSWIVNNVDAMDVPADEGNTDALIFNLVNLCIQGRGYQEYKYIDEQDNWLKELYDEFKNKEDEENEK